MELELTPFQKSAMDFNNHIALTANAGSGKTFVLAKRFLEIALQDDVIVKNIVAITFTEKAAGELFKKINNTVKERIEKENNPIVLRKLKSINDSLVSANISTIHSFCISILKEFSPVAGLDAHFVPIDTRTSNELIYKASEKLLKKLETGLFPSDEIKQLLRVFGSKKQFFEQLKFLIHNRRNFTDELKRLYDSNVENIIEYQNKIFELNFSEIFDHSINEVVNKLYDIFNNVLPKISNDSLVQGKEICEKIINSNSILEKINLLEQLSNIVTTKSGSIRKRGFIPEKLIQEYENEFDDILKLFRDLKEFTIDEENELIEYSSAMFSKELSVVLKYTIEIYDELKYSMGYLDFEDILLLTKKILNNDEVSNALKLKYKFIMIDEYQDTNELQRQIFMPILDSLKRGNLFIVGDEKQSIYMFRGAEIDVFEKTKEDISKSVEKDAILDLPHSFRLSPNIAVFVNSIFKVLFKKPKRLFNEIKSNDLISTRTDCKKSEIELLIKSDSNKESEAEFICQKIIQLSNSGHKLHEMAVLARKRKSLSEVEEQLKLLNIPYEIAGGLGFYQQPIINDLYNYLSFLIDPSNDKALISILRAPFYFLSDNDLFLISKFQGNSFYEKLKNSVIELEYLNDPLVMLQKHLAIVSSNTISEIIRQILCETAYWSVIAARENSDQDLANIEKIITISSEFTKTPFTNSADFLDFFTFAVKELNDEGQADIALTTKGIKLMTIHQSKGLEFDTVFLYKTNEKPIGDKVEARSVILDREFGLISKVPKGDRFFEGMFPNLNVTLFNFIASKRNQAEFKRLLYVALTRTKDNLFVSADIGSGRVNSGSFLDLLINSLGIDLSKNSHTINSELKFMITSEDTFDVKSEKIEIQIPIIKKVGIPEIFKNKDEPSNTGINEILVDDIIDIPSGEIFSASKIALFNNCPVKYHLTYNLGLGKLQKQLSDNFILMDSKLYRESDEDYIPANIRGSLIHKILEKDIDEKSIPKFIKEYKFEFQSSMGNVSLNEIEKICKDMNVYYNSNFYKKINDHKNSKSEYEIYTKQKDNFLYGIIDRLIFEDDKIIIIDYKTDRIESNKINERFENYKIQLMFYGYLVSKLFGVDKEIISYLVFIQHPESYVETKYSTSDLEQFSKKIDEIINKIHQSKFEHNKKHCVNCQYSLNKTGCIY